MPERSANPCCSSFVLLFCCADVNTKEAGASTSKHAMQSDQQTQEQNGLAAHSKHLASSSHALLDSQQSVSEESAEANGSDVPDEDEFDDSADDPAGPGPARAAMRWLESRDRKKAMKGADREDDEDVSDVSGFPGASGELVAPYSCYHCLRGCQHSEFYGIFMNRIHILLNMIEIGLLVCASPCPGLKTKRSKAVVLIDHHYFVTERRVFMQLNSHRRGQLYKNFACSRRFSRRLDVAVDLQCQETPGGRTPCQSVLMRHAHSFLLEVTTLLHIDSYTSSVCYCGQGHADGRRRRRRAPGRMRTWSTMACLCSN